MHDFKLLQGKRKFIFLSENSIYSHILSEKTLDNERKNNHYSALLNPESIPEYGLKIPIEDYKYSNCEYMTDEEFIHYEKKIKNKNSIL